MTLLQMETMSHQMELMMKEMISSMKEYEECYEKKIKERQHPNEPVDVNELYEVIVKNEAVYVIQCACFLCRLKNWPFSLFKNKFKDLGHFLCLFINIWIL